MARWRGDRPPNSGNLPCRRRALTAPSGPDPDAPATGGTGVRPTLRPGGGGVSRTRSGLGTVPAEGGASSVSARVTSASPGRPSCRVVSGRRAVSGGRVTSRRRAVSTRCRSASHRSASARSRRRSSSIGVIRRADVPPNNPPGALSGRFTGASSPASGRFAVVSQGGAGGERGSGGEGGPGGTSRRAVRPARRRTNHARTAKKMRSESPSTVALFALPLPTLVRAPGCSRRHPLRRSLFASACRSGCFCTACNP